MEVSFKEGKGFYSEMFTICFFVLISFGLYLPWGITKMRKEIWSRISIDGERFYYIGRVKELIFGYLLLISLLGGSKFLEYKAPSFLSVNSPLLYIISSVSSLIFFTIVYKAKIGSFRYQVNRTVYNGIKFSTDLPSLGAQYLMCLKWSFLTILTLGLGFVYFSFKADSFKYNSLRYGTEKFSFSMEFKDYLNIVIKNSLKMLILGISLIALYILLDLKASLGFNLKTSGSNSVALIVIGVFAFVFFTAYMYLSSNLFVSLFKKKIDSLRSEKIKINTNITTARAIKHHSINAVIMLFTLGLGFPLALANNIKLYANTLSVDGLDSVILAGHLDKKENSISSSLDDMYSDGFDIDFFDAF